MTVRTNSYGISKFGSADDTAHHWWHDRVKANIVQAAGIPISGYGDEAVRRPKAYGQGFDGIVFRDSNLVVEVVVEINSSPHQQPTIEAWRRTQQTARIITRHLKSFRG